MTGYVYLVTNLVNGKYYVGQTTQKPQQRWAQHGRGTGRARLLNAAIKKHGKESFAFEVLAIVGSLAELNQLEALWIILVGSRARGIGYNIVDGGRNRLLPDEVRQALSNAHRGKPLSVGHRESIGKAHHGKKRGESARANMKAGCVAYYSSLTSSERGTISERNRQNALGNAPWNKGTKGVMVAWNKGLGVSPEEAERLRSIRRSQIMTEERKAQISAALKGRMPAINMRVRREHGSDGRFLLNALKAQTAAKGK